MQILFLTILIILRDDINYEGARILTNSILLAVQATVPNTAADWNWNGSAIIIGTSLLMLLIISRSIEMPQVGRKMPLPFAGLFNNPSVGTFLAAMSAGHLIAIPAVLGLTNLGLL